MLTRGRVAGVVGAAVVVAVLGSMLLLRVWPGEAEPSLPPPLSEEEATVLVADLTSGDEMRVREAYVVAEGVELNPDLAGELAGWRIDLDVSTFTLIGQEVASVAATTTDPGGVTERWLFLLVPVEGRWLLAETLPED